MTRPRRSFTSQWRHAFTRAQHGPDGVSPTAVAVGLVLSDYADWASGTGIRPGRERVAWSVGVSIATVTRAIAALSSAGWLETETSGSFGRSSVYRLTIPPLLHLETGEVMAPISGSPMSHLPTRKRLTGEPLRVVTASRKRLTGAPISGSPMSHHQCHDLVSPLALGSVAA